MSSPFPQPEPLLVLDASGPTLFCGVGAEARWLGTATTVSPALESLTPTIAKTLDAASCSLADIRGFAVCTGPGSILGLRLSVMAVHAWRALPNWRDTSLWAYLSLPAAGAVLAAQNELPARGWLLAPARQGAWNRWRFPEARLDVIPGAELRNANVPLLQVPSRKRWNQAETDCPVRTPDFAVNADWLATPGLLRPVPRLEVFAPGGQEYRRWTPERHRAPSS
ncbi:MAG: hypothetical protein ACFB21_00955 [Opitutales bacterium]